MKKIYTNAFLYRFLTKRKIGLLGMMLSMISLTALTEKAQAQALIDEDFTGQTLPTDWTNVVNTGGTAGNVWTFDNPGGQTLDGGFDGDFAIVDSDDYGSSSDQNTSLTTDTFDASGLAGTLILSFDNSLRNCCGATADVEVWNGTAWINVLSMDAGDDGYPDANVKTIDITAAANGSTQAQIRFTYTGDWDYWWAIDNVLVQEVTCFWPDNVTASVVAATTATINWDAPTAVPTNGYDYYYNTTGIAPTGVTTELGTATGTSTPLIGLSSNTEYHVWVRSVCSTTEKSDWSTEGTFTTAPAPQTPATLPYTDSFTTTGGNWTLLNGEETNRWYIDDATGNTGHSLYISNDNGVTHAYTVSSNASTVQAYRDITFPTGTNPFGVSFDFICKGEGFTTSNYDYFRVWMVPTSYVPTPGTQISSSASDGLQLSGNINNISSWTNQNYVLSDTFGGTTWRLVFEWKNDGSSGTQPPAAIDNINVYEITCMGPSALTSSNIWVNSADVNWTAPTSAPANGYAYYYNTTGTAPTASTTASGFVAAGITMTPLSGLLANTQYYVWVRSLCSTTDQSIWGSPTIFTTLCTAVTAPWLYDVESASTTTSANIADCWSTNPAGSSSVFAWNVDGSGSTPSSSTGPSGAHSGSKYFYTEASNGSSGATAVLKSPPVDLSNLTEPALKFFYHMYGTTMGNLYIEAFDGSTWNMLDSLIGEQQTDDADPWLAKVIPLAGYTGTTQLRFTAVRGSDFYGDISLDDIEIMEMPVCPVPTNISATNIMENSATANWTGDATASHLVEYGASGFTPGTGTIVEATGLSIVIPSLAPNTTYDFYLQRICAVDFIDTSNYSTVTTFTTLCNEVIVNLVDTFMCAASTITLNAGNAGSSFVWSDNSTNQTLDITAAGTYTVTVTNTYGCTGTETVEVTEIAPIVVDLGEDVTICEGDMTTLDAGNPGNTYRWNTTAVTQTINVSSGGTYIVEVTDDNACKGTDSIDVTLLEAPKALGITAIYQNDGSYNFFAVGVTNVDEYLWDFGDGSATSDEEAPNHLYANSGNYTVNLSVFNECGNDTTAVLLPAHGTSIDQLMLDDNQLRLYPNPADHLLHIENNSNFKMKEVVVYNILGQIVFQSKVDNEKHFLLNVSSFSSGIYQIRLQMDEGFLSRKFEIRK